MSVVLLEIYVFHTYFTHCIIEKWSKKQNKVEFTQKIWCFPSVELLDAALEEEGGTLIARKVGEAVQNTFGAVVGAIDIPLGEH